MKIVGLTGGVGCGKTAVAGVFEKAGASVVDTDALARLVVEPGNSVLLEIQQHFGSDVIDGSGRLRRDYLAQIVFSDPPGRQKLEAIMHPRIRALWQERVKMWRKNGKAIAVVVIPLLFETGAETEFDKTICVACSSDTQHSRLRIRGWSDGQISQRIAAQWPIEQKMAKADFVVWTEGDLEVTAEQLWKILNQR